MGEKNKTIKFNRIELKNAQPTTRYKSNSRRGSVDYDAGN